MCPLHTSSVARSHNFAASAVSRRQQFLIRSLEGVQGSAPSRRMAGGMTNVNSLGLEADAGSILKRITPPLDPGLHKGQAGEISFCGIVRFWLLLPFRVRSSGERHAQGVDEDKIISNRLRLLRPTGRCGFPYRIGRANLGKIFCHGNKLGRPGFVCFFH